VSAAQIASIHRYQANCDTAANIISGQSFAEEAHQRFKRLYLGADELTPWHPDWPVLRCDGVVCLQREGFNL
jgi:hypothetical protein